MVVWVTETPRREFFYVDDIAAATVRLMSARHCTSASGSATGYPGRIVFDASKPDGMPHKLSISRGILRRPSPAISRWPEAVAVLPAALIATPERRVDSADLIAPRQIVKRFLVRFPPHGGRLD